MASTKTTELSATEIELKRRGRRRLIGAATIGLLGIVFLPMIFDHEPKRSSAESNLKKQEISIQVPGKEGLPQLPSPTAVPSPSIAAPPAPVSSAPAVIATSKVASPETAKVVTETPAAKLPAAGVAPKVDKVDKVDTTPKTATPKSDTAKKGFAVQLGVFAGADNAKQTIEKMKDANLPVYSDSIPIKTGNATRVRVGPYATRENADSALAQIKLVGGDGKIVPLQ